MHPVPVSKMQGGWGRGHPVASLSSLFNQVLLNVPCRRTFGQSHFPCKDLQDRLVLFIKPVQVLLKYRGHRTHPKKFSVKTVKIILIFTPFPLSLLLPFTPSVSLHN